MARILTTARILARDNLKIYIYLLMKQPVVKKCLWLSLLLLPTIYHCKNQEKTTSQKAISELAITVLPADREYDPLVGSIKKKGGTISTWGGPFPRSFNYWIDSSFQAAQVISYLFEPLAQLHSTSDRPIGVLANQWSQKSDGRTIIFRIDPRAQWSDGRPVLASDIVFYYDTIMNPEYRTTLTRATLSRFERPKILADRVIQIRAKRKYWKVFWDAASFMAFPEHAWRDKNFNQIQFEFQVVSGPYSLHQMRKNRFVMLKRRNNWWGRHKAYNQGKYNFDYIRFRYTSDRIASLEYLKKEKLDVYAIYTSSIWQQQTRFNATEKNWVIRQEIKNRRPLGFQGFAINLRKRKFQDLRVRRALCHILPRNLMNEKLMFNQYFILHSYFPDLTTGNQTSRDKKNCNYDLQRARSLLTEAGYRVNRQGLREKDGKILEINFITNSTDLRHFQVFMQELQKVGIVTSLRQSTAATLAQKIDHFEFDLFWVNVGASRLLDPQPLFISETADQIGSINWPGLKDTIVDQLLNRLKKEKRLSVRKDLLRSLDRRLLAIHPFLLLWQADHSRLLYWNKFSFPPSVLDKYSNEDSIFTYWSLDPSKEKSLRLAQQRNDPLPPEPASINFQEPVVNHL